MLFKLALLSILSYNILSIPLTFQSTIMSVNNDEEARPSRLRMCDGCCYACCCFGCSIIGILCCCKQMSRSTRMKLLFIYLQVIGVILGVVTGVVYFGPVSNRLEPTGMKYVFRHLSPVFCEGVAIESKMWDVTSPETFTAYLVDMKPEIDSNKRQTYNESITKYISKDTHAYQTFYLLEGSSVRLTLVTQSLSMLYVVQGRRNLIF